jgi:hypothetical protein
MGKQRLAEKGHIARHDERPIGLGGMNGGVERAEGAAIRYQVGDHRHAGSAEPIDIVGNDDYPIDHAAQPRQLAIQNGCAAGMQNQAGLVQPSKTLCATASKDGTGPHGGFIGRRISEE